jgi:hypothetical protein
MNTHDDFEEFLRLLNEHQVEYVIVGGYAVAFHGYVRVTKDLDILYRNTPDNILRLRKALNSFGFDAASLSEVAFSEQGRIIRMGASPVMIELINAVSGLTFDQAWSDRVRGEYGEVQADYLSKASLIVNMRAAGRPQDIADCSELESAQEGEP